MPYASWDLDINSLLGGSIYERLKPKVFPVLKDIKALAEGKQCGPGTQTASTCPASTGTAHLPTLPPSLPIFLPPSLPSSTPGPTIFPVSSASTLLSIAAVNPSVHSDVSP